MSPLFKLPTAGQRGVRLFNQGEYYRCHDAFEEVWQKKSGEERYYYQGLIQIAVALFKIKEEGNWRGAVALLSKGKNHLEAVDPARVELDLERLKSESGQILEKLKSLGPQRIGEIDNEKFPKLHYMEKPEK